MKPLNASDIATAYFSFLGQFLLLMLSIVLVVSAFLHTFTEQTLRLRNYRSQYEHVLFTQLQMGQKTDSIYADLGLLNTKLVSAGAERLIEQRVLHRKDELDAMLQSRYSHAQPHEAYRRVTDCLNEMLVLKDSIHNVEGRIQEVRYDLRDCQKTGRRPK
jgi:hypothetical protein